MVKTSSLRYLFSRVSKRIPKLVNDERFRYFPTELNPSDIGSRGAHYRCPSDAAVAVEVKSELKVPPVESVTVLNDMSCDLQGIQNVINCEDYSSLDKLLRVTTRLLQFIENFKRKKNGIELVTDISFENIEFAKLLWHKEAQSFFGSDKTFRKTKETLRVYVDDQGILRCKGRIGNTSLPYPTKFPILLPREHHFTELLIRQCHENVMHNGTRETLTELRANYWVTRERQTVKRLLSKCIVCKKIQGKAYSTPPEPSLPDFKVSEDLPFSKTALDFAGPLYVKNIYNKKNFF